MRGKFAYSVIGEGLARMLQTTLVPARAHCIQDAFAGHNMQHTQKLLQFNFLWNFKIHKA
jgi:hypothetical protein